MSSVLHRNLGAVTESTDGTVVDEASSVGLQELRNDDPLASILPIMSKYGARSSREEFHRSVNLAFHRAESRVYDQLHSCMWESLPEQCQLLVQDYLETGVEIGRHLVALDIGCGTGLASDMLLNSQMGKHISRIDLLDISEEMLGRARDRARSWSATATLLHGELERLTRSSPKYDVVVVCSVLHHIPDLGKFLKRVRTIQSPGGIFLHLQDPNGDFFHDPEQKRRIAELAGRTRHLPGWLRRLNPRRVLGALQCRLSGRQPDSYIRQVNDELLAARITTKAMSAPDIWAVTDLHCSDGLGVQINQLCRCLPDYTLISKRSYGFFGKLYSELPEGFKKTEKELIHQKAPNGLYIAGIWKKNKS
jgi:2-polyprenyl-3-methyl-5-hydroxy-6-metoxy-1,4-benzoquinol methylase